MIYRNLGVFDFFLIFAITAANYIQYRSGRDHFIQNDLIKKTTAKPVINAFNSHDFIYKPFVHRLKKPHEKTTLHKKQKKKVPKKPMQKKDKNTK
uniref:Uncharacterized protein n=1 Tax=Strongyloides papillosus TaxID=174720 RepID=A0A0N5BLD9_STREA